VDAHAVVEKARKGDIEILQKLHEMVALHALPSLKVKWLNAIARRVILLVLMGIGQIGILGASAKLVIASRASGVAIVLKHHYQTIVENWLKGTSRNMRNVMGKA
jgi:hypothetical protein